MREDENDESGGSDKANLKAKPKVEDDRKGEKSKSKEFHTGKPPKEK